MVSAETGLPLRRAVVTLQPVVSTPTRLSRRAATDGQGRFEFTEVQAASYTLQAQKGAYATWMFGQRRATDKGLPVEIADGEVRERLDIALPRGGVISGRVLDEGGDPVAGAVVAAMRIRYVQRRRQTVVAGFAAATDDRGEYRLYGTPAGKFYACVLRLDGKDIDVPLYHPSHDEPSRCRCGDGSHRAGTLKRRHPLRPITKEPGQRGRVRNRRAADGRCGYSSGEPRDAPCDSNDDQAGRELHG